MLFQHRIRIAQFTLTCMFLTASGAPIVAQTGGETALPTPSVIVENPAYQTPVEPVPLSLEKSGAIGAPSENAAPTGGETPPAPQEPLTAVVNVQESDTATATLPGEQPKQPTDWTVNYTPNTTLNITAGGNKTTTPTAGWSDAGHLTMENSYVNVDYHPERFPGLSYQHMEQQLAQAGSSAGKSTQTTDSVTGTWNAGKVTAAVNLNRTTAKTQQSTLAQPVVGGESTLRAAAFPETTTTPATSTTDTATLDLGYQASERLGLGVRVGTQEAATQINGEQTKGGGVNVQANATYRAAENMTYSVNMQTGQTRAQSGQFGLLTPAQQNQSMAMRADWQPAPGWTVGAGYQDDHATADALSVADSTLAFAAGTPGTQNKNTTANQQAGVDVGFLNEKVQAGISLLARAGKSEGSGYNATNAGTDLNVHASYQASEQLAINGSMQTSVNTGQYGGDDLAMTPSQQENRSTNLNMLWKPNAHVQLGLNYLDSRYTDANYGQQSNNTTAATAAVQTGANTRVNGYLVQQQAETPGLTGSESHLAGVGAQWAPNEKMMVGVDVQRVWGNDGNGVGQLLQTEGQSRRVQTAGTQPVTSMGLTGTDLTAVAASIRYQPKERHELALTGEYVTGTGLGGPVQAGALGLGWHYSADENLQFNLDARQNFGSSGLQAPTQDLSASMTWHF